MNCLEVETENTSTFSLCHSRVILAGIQPFLKDGFPTQAFENDLEPLLDHEVNVKPYE